MSIAKKGLQQYLQQLQQHPLRTKALTAGVLSAISDIVSQKLSGIQKLQIRRLLLKVLMWGSNTPPQTECVQPLGGGGPRSDIMWELFVYLLMVPLSGNLRIAKSCTTLWSGGQVCVHLPPGPHFQLFGCAYLGPFGHFYHLLLDKLFKGKKDSATVAKKVLLEQVTSSPWNNLIFMLYYGLVIEGRPWIHVKSKIKKEYPTVQYAAWTFWPVIGWINHRHVPLQFRVIVQSFVAMCWGIFLNLRARSLTLTKD